jgi:hypothetical protein
MGNFMKVALYKKDMDDIKNLIEDSGSFALMNDKGLSLPAMAFVLQTLCDGVGDALKVMENENNNIESGDNGEQWN